MAAQMEVRELAEKMAIARLVTVDPKEIIDLAESNGLDLSEKELQEAYRLVIGAKVFVH